MSSTVEAVEPDTSLLDVAERFAEAEFKRFPVVANGFLVGQISRFDVLRAVDQLLQE
jgi:CBS domain-containing protein